MQARRLAPSLLIALLTLTGCGLGLNEVVMAATVLADATRTAPAPLPGTQPAPAQATRPSSQELQRALDAANRERAAVSLPPLAWSDQLAAVAEAHSRDMADHGFFDHENPAGQSPFDRMKAAGITYRAAAENIAQNNSDDGEAVIDQWMHSPGHKANILGKSYGRMGLGMATAANGEVYWTQTFTN